MSFDILFCADCSVRCGFAAVWIRFMWMISWVAVDWWKAGSYLAVGGTPPKYVEVLGSTKSSPSCFLWTYKNLPETLFRFLTATLIALEQFPSERSNKPMAIECKRYLPNVQLVSTLWALQFFKWKISSLTLPGCALCFTPFKYKNLYNTKLATWNHPFCWSPYVQICFARVLS